MSPGTATRAQGSARKQCHVPAADGHVPKSQKTCPNLERQTTKILKKSILLRGAIITTPQSRRRKPQLCQMLPRTATQTQGSTKNLPQLSAAKGHAHKSHQTCPNMEKFQIEKNGATETFLGHLKSK